MRRFTRLTNGFSKKIDNHGHAVALHFMVRFRRGCEACLCEGGPTAHGPSALEVIGKQGVQVIADAIAQIVADGAHTV
jgi:hypothetical protein